MLVPPSRRAFWDTRECGARNVGSVSVATIYSMSGSIVWITDAGERIAWSPE